MRLARREKVFGPGQAVPLDRNAKARITAYARAWSHLHAQPGQCGSAWEGDRSIARVAQRATSRAGRTAAGDQVYPMFTKAVLKPEAVIGIVGSTNHRFRVLTVFRRV